LSTTATGRERRPSRLEYPAGIASRHCVTALVNLGADDVTGLDPEDFEPLAAAD